MPNVLITNQGLDFVSSANDNGVYIDLRYFIPVYDDRIDSSVRNTSALSSFSDIADKTITEPYGEKIWRRKHTLGDASTFLISAVEFNSSKLTNTYQKSSVVTNLYNGTPLSDQVSATSWSATGGPSLWTWEALAGGQGIEGDDSQPGTGADGLGFTDGYYPTYDTSAENRLRGSFKFKIDESWGNIKFNKIAMYAVAVNADGDDITSIGYFGEAYLSAAAVRSDLGVGYDLFEIDVQIDLSGVSANWDNLFYSSSADYWSHSPGGLYYPGRIGVGIFEDGQKEISATMHVRRERTSGTINDDIPQLRIDQDYKRFWTIEVVSEAYDIRNSATSGGDMVIGIADWDSFTGDALAIRPSVDGSVSLGTNDFSFRELWLWNFADGDEESLDDVIPLNVQNLAENYAARFNATQVFIGKSDGRFGNDKFALRVDDLGVDIISGSDQYGAFRGGDIVKDSQNLLIYNTFYHDSGNDIGVENVYLFAGLDLSSTYYSVDGQSGATHKNILYQIENAEPGLFSGTNENLATGAEVHIAAKGKIGLHGPIEIQNLSEYADTANLANAIVISRENELRMMIGAGILDTTSYNTLTDRMSTISEMPDLFDASSRLFLVAGNIHVNGNIVPLQGPSYDVGDVGRRFDVGYFNAGNFFCAQSRDGWYERNRNYALGGWVYGDEQDIFSNALTTSELVDLYSSESSLGIESGDVITISVTDESGELSKTINVTSTSTVQDLVDKINEFSSVTATFESGRFTVSPATSDVESIEYFNDGDAIAVFNAGPLNSSRKSDVLQVVLSIDQAFTKVGKIAFVKGSVIASSTGSTPISVELPSELERKTFTDNLGYFQGSVFPESSLGNTNLFVIYPVSESDSNSLEIKPTAGNQFTINQKYYYSVSYDCNL